MSRYSYNVIDLHLDSMDSFFDKHAVNPMNRAHSVESGISILYRQLRLSVPKSRGKLILHLPANTTKETNTLELVEAIKKYCGSKIDIARNDYRMLILTGKKALLVGIFFLGLCLSLSYLIQEQMLFPDLAKYFVKEGLYIIGWVGMWKPIEIFLYEWWPFQRQMRVWSYIREMKIEVVV
ncbi:MAG: hypothetical protein WEC59_12085 [Salibacteraceae bacterium]